MELTLADSSDGGYDSDVVIVENSTVVGAQLSPISKEEEKEPLEKSTYAPNEIDSLPLQTTTYSNAVRSNMIRHLQAHLKDESALRSSPANPVPRLDEKERTLSKMADLAISPHENGGGSSLASSTTSKRALLPEEGRRLPTFVPENQSPRHMVERPDERVVINEPQTAEKAQQNLQPPSLSSTNTTSSQADPDGNARKCNWCEFKYAEESAIQQHLLNAHKEKCEFKCNACPFKSSSKATLDQHTATAHPFETRVGFTISYQRIQVRAGPTKPESERASSSRGREDVHQTRGIPSLEGTDQPADSSKRKSADSDGKSTGAGAKRVRGSGVDANVRPRLPDGDHGRPVGKCYSCPLCDEFKAKHEHCFRNHMFCHLKHSPWTCTACDYRCVKKADLVEHLAREHESSQLVPVCVANKPIEQWVERVILAQTDIMRSAEESEEFGLVVEARSRDEAENDDRSDGETPSGVPPPAPLTSRHCQVVFSESRAFRRHVRREHLEQLAFTCPYCVESADNDAAMLQHLRDEHRDQPQRMEAIVNKTSEKMSPEFWRREYGLAVSERANKRKRKEAVAELPSSKCSSTAVAALGPEAEVKQKCSYCAFVSFDSSEMRSHWQAEHPHLDFKSVQVNSRV